MANLLASTARRTSTPADSSRKVFLGPGEDFDGVANQEAPVQRQHGHRGRCRAALLVYTNVNAKAFSTPWPTEGAMPGISHRVLLEDGPAPVRGANVGINIGAETFEGGAALSGLPPNTNLMRM